MVLGARVKRCLRASERPRRHGERFMLSVMVLGARVRRCEGSLCDSVRCAERRFDEIVLCAWVRRCEEVWCDR
jgi:hypothetical protein